ncbi:hypothetical protein [Kitasatospora sp. NPDC097643]|uniref:GAP1-N2 domain-containing protein n=1 Tax=Kitasatospora sp. NPDC097643 TaxID=3157230 RepID=UPI00332F6805
MAGQAHFTSAPPQPGSTQAGFRFTAVSPTAHPALGALTPLLGYGPPPGAPSAPTPQDIAAFPLAFSYRRLPDAAVLAQCRYTGQDYTGRWGNYFGHAVHALPEELAGLRPVELWRSPLWAGAAAPDGTALPDLRELPPGPAVAPDRVAEGFRAAAARCVGPLTDLLSAVLDRLRRPDRDRPIALVSADADRTAAWIAAVSYALPAPLAAELSFTTYTDRPGEARHHLAGTVPEVWQRDRGRGPALLIDTAEWDGAGEDTGTRPGLAARLLARAWVSGDVDLLDGVAELWELTGSTRDRPDQAVTALQGACALVAAARGELAHGALDPADHAALTALLDRTAARGEPLPDALRAALAREPAPPGIDHRLAVELAQRYPEFKPLAQRALAARLHTPGPRRADGTVLGELLHDLDALQATGYGPAPAEIRSATRHRLAAAPAPLGPALGLLPPAARPAPGEGPGAELPEAYRWAVFHGVLDALETCPELYHLALDRPTCVQLVSGPPQPPEAWSAVPRTAVRVFSVGFQGAAEPALDRAVGSLLKLHREHPGLDTTEVTRALRRLLSPLPEQPAEPTADSPTPAERPGRSGRSRGWFSGRGEG